MSLGGVCGSSLWVLSPVGCHFSNICFPADSSLLLFLPSCQCLLTVLLLKRETDSFLLSDCFFRRLSVFGCNENTKLEHLFLYVKKLLNILL